MDDTQPISGQSGAPSNQPDAGSASHKRLLLILGAAIAVFAAVIAYNRFHSSSAGLDFQNVRVERLTQSGKANGVAISPDGKSIVYIQSGAGGESLMLRQLQTGGEKQIVAPNGAMHMGVSFSPDGNSLYYTASSKDNQLFSLLYRLPLQNGQAGQAQEIVQDIDTGISFSPDGTKFAFLRGVPDRGENHLIIANADGSGLKIVAKKAGQVSWQTLIAPAWSPDGKTIVFANYQAPARRALLAIAPDGSNFREIFTTHNYLGRPQWLRDGTGVLVPIREESVSERGQLWAVGFPAGQATKLTGDLTDYSVKWLDLDRNASTLVGIETTITGDLWLLPEGDSNRARKISAGDSPVFYVTTLGKDHVLYETRDTGVFVADADGSNPKQVLAHQPGIQDISGCGDGNHILYAQLVGEESNIWRIDAHGSNPLQLTREKSAVMPNCSPDGKWLFYWNDDERSLYRLSIEGGKSAKVTLPNLSNPFTRISPDAKAVLYAGENPKGPTKPYVFSVAPLANGNSSTHFEAIPGMGMTVPQWDPEGHGFYLNLTRQGATNIWKMESPGGPVKQITNFPSGLIASYVWSSDGKNLFVARGTKTNDVVLLRSPR